jgi:hypothetical protein
VCGLRERLLRNVSLEDKRRRDIVAKFCGGSQIEPDKDRERKHFRQQ